MFRPGWPRSESGSGRKKQVKRSAAGLAPRAQHLPGRDGTGSRGRRHALHKRRTREQLQENCATVPVRNCAETAR
jgi:hypothetical protein